MNRDDFTPPLETVDLPAPEFTVSPIGWVFFHEDILYKVLSQEGNTVRCIEVTVEEADTLARSIQERRSKHGN